MLSEKLTQLSPEQLIELTGLPYLLVSPSGGASGNKDWFNSFL